LTLFRPPDPTIQLGLPTTGIVIVFREAYNTVCQAIAAAYGVDAFKQIRDQALAIEVYARQAHNTEAESKACEIQLRAERRCGQLLKQMEKNRGGRPAENQSHAATGSDTLAALGISKTQSARWQQLADIPNAEFERTFRHRQALHHRHHHRT
jgi:hypothetical protein